MKYIKGGTEILARALSEYFGTVVIDYQHLAEGSYLHEFLFEKENRGNLARISQNSQNRGT